MTKNPTIDSTNGKSALSLNTYHVKYPKYPAVPKPPKMAKALLERNAPTAIRTRLMHRYTNFPSSLSESIRESPGFS